MHSCSSKINKTLCIIDIVNQSHLEDIGTPQVIPKYSLVTLVRKQKDLNKVVNYRTFKMANEGVSGISDKFCLKWNDFESSVSSAFRELRNDKDFFDVTLVCGGNQLEAHKVILSACSPFFHGVLKRNPHTHPLIYLKGIKYENVLAVLNFMYHGEVNIAQEDLNSFLAVAEDLKVKGLTQGSTSESDHQPSPVPLPKRAAEPPKQHCTGTSPLRPANDPSMRPPQSSRMTEVGCGIKTEHLKTEPQHQLVDLQEEQYREEAYGGQDYQEDFQDMEHDFETPAVGQDRSILNKHIVRGGGFNGWQCSICGKDNTQKSNLLNHVESAHFPGMFQYSCTVCGKELKTKNALNLHMGKQHRNKDQGVSFFTSPTLTPPQ